MARGVGGEQGRDGAGQQDQPVRGEVQGARRDPAGGGARAAAGRG